MSSYGILDQIIPFFFLSHQWVETLTIKWTKEMTLVFFDFRAKIFIVLVHQYLAIVIHDNLYNCMSMTQKKKLRIGLM